MKLGIRKRQIVSTFSLLVLGGFAAGCYERVVRAEGLGAQGVAVQEPYRSETKLDQAFFPDGSSSGSSSSSSSNSSMKNPKTPRPPR